MIYKNCITNGYRREFNKRSISFKYDFDTFETFFL